ncbi:hypothetical protein, conserved [Entamoeba dispar SAW760]|uniref:Uncharacterized protein n=1 Tax=Entamoeba dispar (strain ATCC PRA-260 / SAW760) TaxID=370354 RepID=B0EKD7_ENTDS|nr:uncharacterized protein EDI_328970 [Entamoeba dispar SAW760]EDR25007.1 hypothetical protein, conserved [Entamoeba dispar SAW760]|eukprot:EDR25007.1 hypothetical protein, conserved [Entamoeba dispar SAW760]
MKNEMIESITMKMNNLHKFYSMFIFILIIVITNATESINNTKLIHTQIKSKQYKRMYNLYKLKGEVEGVSETIPKVTRIETTVDKKVTRTKKRDKPTTQESEKGKESKETPAVKGSSETVGSKQKKEEMKESEKHPMEKMTKEVTRNINTLNVQVDKRLKQHIMNKKTKTTRKVMAIRMEMRRGKEKGEENETSQKKKGMRLKIRKVIMKIARKKNKDENEEKKDKEKTSNQGKEKKDNEQEKENKDSTSQQKSKHKTKTLKKRIMNKKMKIKRSRNYAFYSYSSLYYYIDL